MRAWFLTHTAPRTEAQEQGGHRNSAIERRGPVMQAKDESPAWRAYHSPPKDATIAIVVAHPDDETLWAGGQIQSLDSPTVICCSIPVRDSIRAWKFFDACDVLGARPRLLPYPEVLGGPLSYLTSSLGRAVLAPYDVIVTHNAEGEYGHQHHIQVHDWVRQNFTGPVYGFGHGLGYMPKLPELAFQTKLRAMRCYDHVSPTDSGQSKVQALLRVYKDLDREGIVAYA